MADLAHDASGPASSEPAGIALQQANRPSSSDRGKLRVFISYSRDDLKFADQLDDALNACGFECLIDRHGISGGEDWKRRLGNLISEADTVVFVLSPSSARSEICDWEVKEAAQLNKRILPVNCRPLEGVSPPPRLRELNHIFFYEEPKLPGSGFGNGLAKLVAALNTDFDWLREHTRYLQRAMEWDTGGRPANRLLSGNDILDAKAWVAARPKGAPEPTALQLDFIRASEEEADARLSEQRKQLEAMAYVLARATTIVGNILGFDPDRVRPGLPGDGPQDQIKNEAFALFQAGAKHGDARSMNNLGVSYQKGWGTPQDEAKAREWYEKAAAKDFAPAMFMLGALFEMGRGVPQDLAKAREWYEKAAARGDELAPFNLDRVSICEAETAGRYDEALRIMEALAAKFAKREGTPGEKTAESLNYVIWLALFAKEYTKALAVADRAHALFPDNLRIETNRAHALMFMRHDKEAKALYLAHKGQRMSDRDDRLWERVIAEDFAQFRKAGLTHPMMAAVEKELGISR